MTVQQAFDLALQHHQNGRLVEAEALYRQVHAAQPDHSDALHFLGVIAHQAGDHERAVELIGRSLALHPDNAFAYANLGEAYRAMGQLDEAITSFRQALALDPNLPPAHNNLGLALTLQGRVDEALEPLRCAIRLNPDYADAHYNLGNAFKDLHQFDAALAEFQRAIQLKPDHVQAYSNMAVALCDQGRVSDALDACRRALQFDPRDAEVHSNLATALHYQPGSNAQVIAEEHTRWQQQHAEPLRQFIRPHANDRDPNRRLRVGYVSPDFREHSVAFFVENLLACHDTAQVEVFCYASLARPDAVTARLQRLATHWREIFGRPDAEIAELIRHDQIDILVDLAGHTAGNRLPLFARKPAPIQVTWLGYPDFTGLEAMDYRLTDALSDPPGTTEHLHREQLILLPRCAWCFRPSADAPPVSPLPALAAGHVTFGCFNALPKINEPQLRRWSEILRAVPGSRLLLKNRSLGDPSTQERLRSLLEESGVAQERVELIASTPHPAEHLALYRRVDIALDTFPYHGTTTTCEALWMGVPVVTQAGQTHASRVGVSLLTNVGLPELITRSPEEYGQTAATLAGDLPRLSELRGTLRTRMEQSPLMDAPRFARDIEAAYRTMWRQWCMQNQPARS